MKNEQEMNRVADEQLKDAVGGECDHMDHNHCCRCGWVATQEMERTYSKKWTKEKGGDGKWHFFCINCVRELGL